MDHVARKPINVALYVGACASFGYTVEGVTRLLRGTPNLYTYLFGAAHGAIAAVLVMIALRSIFPAPPSGARGGAPAAKPGARAAQPAEQTSPRTLLKGVAAGPSTAVFTLDEYESMKSTRPPRRVASPRKLTPKKPSHKSPSKSSPPRSRTRSARKPASRWSPSDP